MNYYLRHKYKASEKETNHFQHICLKSGCLASRFVFHRAGHASSGTWDGARGFVAVPLRDENVPLEKTLAFSLLNGRFRSAVNGHFMSFRVTHRVTHRAAWFSVRPHTPRGFVIASLEGLRDSGRARAAGLADAREAWHMPVWSAFFI